MRQAHPLTCGFGVELMGLEPTTPCLQSRCSSQLSYSPEGVLTLTGAPAGVRPILGGVDLRRRPARLVATLVVTVLVAAACGSGDDEAAPADDAEATTTTAPADVAFAHPYTGHTSEVYADDAHWLCRPDLSDDVCDQDLTATEVAPDGTLTEVPFQEATDAPIDCFYVYPTLDYSAEPGNHPFEVPNPLEAITTQFQAARFGSLCNLYAPRYRQATIGSYPERGDDVDDLFDLEPFAIAYADVLDAFQTYLATDNDGRPFVLLGHSQGTHHLIRLLQEEFDDDPALRAGLVSALLVGPTGRLRVPPGEEAGGTFENIPLCASADQTGCAVGFDSYAASEPPDFVDSVEDGTVRACVSPTELVDGDDRLEAGYFGVSVPGVETATEIIPDHYAAECAETDDGQVYLAIAADPPPGDTRAIDHISPRIAETDSLHTADYNFALGDLLALVEAQLATLR